MAKTNLGETALKLGGVTEITVTPFVNGVKGTDVYILDDIVADSTTITQEDPTIDPTNAETKDDPIFENITLGKYTFAATSGDIQKILLEKLMGFTVDTTNKRIYAPASYKEIWAEIEVIFGDKGSLVCPKVKLNSKIEAASLKTGMVQGTISGTCYSTNIGTEEAKIISPFYVVDPTITTGGA